MTLVAEPRSRPALPAPAPPRRLPELRHRWVLPPAREVPLVPPPGVVERVAWEVGAALYREHAPTDLGGPCGRCGLFRCPTACWAFDFLAGLARRR